MIEIMLGWYILEDLMIVATHVAAITDFPIPIHILDITNFKGVRWMILKKSNKDSNC